MHRHNGTLYPFGPTRSYHKIHEKTFRTVGEEPIETPSSRMQKNERMVPDLESKLSKIRDSPNLQSQQQTRVVLSSVEEILRQQNSLFTPAAYFAALLSLLGDHGSIRTANDVINAVVYLLDLVTPHVPHPLLRAKFVHILENLTPVLSHEGADAPFVRASLGILVSLLIVQDAQSWNLPASQPGPRQALNGLLKLATDTRPKVRKRAQDGIVTVLSNGPATPSLDHPAADMCAETALKIFENLAGEDPSRRQPNQPNAHDPMLIHVMQLIKAIAKSSRGWPSRGLESLTKTLFMVARSRSEYLTTTAFEVFETIFEGMASDEGSEKLPFLLDAIVEIQPSQSDSQLLPSWIAAISRGYDVWSQVDDNEAFQKLPQIFQKVSTFLSSPSYAIRVSASECLISFLVNCVPVAVILEPSIMDDKCFEKLSRTMNELFDVKFQAAWMEVFNVLKAMLENFRWKSVPLLNKAVQTVGELRSSQSFQNKEKADDVLSLAVKFMGPETVLTILPLNLGSPTSTKQGRAWLIPIVRDNVSNTELSHFRKDFVPLSEKLFQKVMGAGEQKTMESKIHETLVHQIWSCLPGYCDRPTDVQQAFDQKFAEMISNLLYQKPEMRNDLCRALQNLVDGYKSILEKGEPEDLMEHNRITKAAAQANVSHLSSFAANVLAVLFNVYGETAAQHRHPILSSINAYLSITPPAALSETFDRVSTAFESTYAEQTAKGTAVKESKKPKPNTDPMILTLMDIVVTMTTYLPRESYQRLFALASTLVSQQHDPSLQKKAYKLVPRLAQSEAGSQAIVDRSAELQQMLLTNTDNTLAPARKDRLSALIDIVKRLPDADLSFIPNIVPEAILRTKETNERARETAFTLIVTMGDRMRQGGTVDHSRVANASSAAAPVQATVEEYFTILSAGLAGSTPHMISASVTAISRALFSFHADLSPQTASEILNTMSLFLESPTREVVRSVLGFVKISVISLPQEVIQPHLPEMIPRLISWNHVHKEHFRAKVKNILERIIRRFGLPIVERHCPEEDQKLITNIRKTRERRKRNKSKTTEDRPAEDEDGPARAKFANAFDQAVYGSDDSASSDDDDDDAPNPEHKARRGKPSGKAFIQEDSTDPLDLLDSKALSRISSTRPLKTPKPTKKRAKRDADGKLILDDAASDGEEDDDANMHDPLDQNADSGTLEQGIDAYVDAIRGRHAAQRGRGGRLKFKNVKKDDGDVEMGDDDASKPARGGMRSPTSPRGKMMRGSASRGGVKKRGRGGFAGAGRGRWMGPRGG